MRSSMDSFNEIKDVKSRRGIRDDADFRKNAEDRSNSEPPRSFVTYLPARLKPIHEKDLGDEGSSDEDNSQLNGSELDLEIPESASASVSQAPTPTPLSVSHARRINSETNLNDSKRRLSGFMGNRSKRFCASTSELLSFSSHLDTQKSLFSAKNNALSRQSFNSSLYGSNASLSSTNSRLFMVTSPFYNGKTMFGGASAYPKRDIITNQHKNLRTAVQMRPSSSLSNSSGSEKPAAGVPESNAAKRILEVMNQFSGPIKEARTMGNNINSFLKIPSLVQDRKRFGEEDRVVVVPPATPYGRPVTVRTRPESPISGPSIKPLQIPTMSQLLQMKKLQSNTEKVREIASKSDSFLNKDQEYKLPTAGSGNGNGDSGTSSFKMKSNITKNLLRNDKNILDMPALPVNLPNVQLPELKSIPKFDIQIATTKQNSTAAVTPASVKSNVLKSPQKCSMKAWKEKSMTEFVLSKPILLDSGVGNVRDLDRASAKYVFSKPLLIDENGDLKSAKSSVASPKQSSLDTNSTDNLFKNLVAKQKASSWECDSCLTRNDSEKTQCLCCSTARKTNEMTAVEPSKAPAPSSKPDDLFSSFVAKQKTSTWECDGCMVKNNANVEKCPCCGTSKPGSKPISAAVTSSATFTFGMKPTTQQNSSGDDLFKKLVSKQNSQWECEVCMVRNESSRSTCMSCETPKPGCDTAPLNSSESAPKPVFSFGMPASATTSQPMDDNFKKLVAKQSSNWECSACMTRNEQSILKCLCCEQAKPGASPKAASFSFGGKLTTSVTLPAPSEVKFKFGMPTASLIPAPAQKASEANESVSEKKDEVDVAKISSEAKIDTMSAVISNETLNHSAFAFKAPQPSVSEVQNTDPQSNEEDKKDKQLFMFQRQQEVKPKEDSKKPEQGEFKFASNSEQESKPAQSPSNGGFSLGGDSSKSETFKLKEGFTFDSSAFSSSKVPTFGTQTQAAKPSASPVQTPASNTFVFGQSKTDNTEPSKVFGSFAPTQPTSAFGQTQSFGFSSISEKSTDSANKMQPSIFSFGSEKLPVATPSSTLFGSSANSVTPTPGFGTSSNNNNNVEFGSKMPSFGNQPQKRSFEFSAGEVTQSKKFDFGAPQGNVSQPFKFGSASVENKPPAFNFSSTSQGFSFSNSAQTNPQASAPPVMQFGSGNANVPQIAIPGITFTAQGTGSSAAANQRKILRAARRTVNRR